MVYEMEAVLTSGSMAKFTEGNTPVELRMGTGRKLIRLEATTQANSSMGKSMALAKSLIVMGMLSKDSLKMTN